MPAIEGYAHLAKDPGYRSGVPRIAAAGIRVYTIWQLYRHGTTPEQMVEDYAPLDVGAVFSALAYAFDHLDEMRAYEEIERKDEEEFRKTYVMNPKIKAALEAARESGQVLS